MTTPKTLQPVSIGRFVELINGFAFPSDGFTEADGMPLIRIRDLTGRETEINFHGRYKERYVVTRGDLLIGMDGDFLTAKWKGNDALLNQRVCKLVTKNCDSLDQDFLFYRISEEITKIHRITAATTVKHLSSKDVLGIEIDIPPIQEQTKIAEILSTVDHAIEQTEAVIAKQQRIKTGLMQDLLTYGIDEHGNLRSERTHQFKESPLGKIPVGWEAARISSVLADSPKNGYSPTESNEWNGSYLLGLGCLTTDGFRPKQLKFSPPPNPSIEAARLQAGDFLISRSNTRALVGLVGVFRDIGEPCIYPDLMVRLVFTREVSTDYMEQVFMSSSMRHQIQNAATGTSGSMVKITGALIKQFSFMKPPIEEQHRILSALKTQASNLKNHLRLLSKLRSLKIALMQDLLTGKKRVTLLLEPETKREKMYAGL